MSNIKPESLSWVDQLETLRTLGPSASRADRKKALKVGHTQITHLISLEACFNQAAIAKVRQAAQATPPYILSFTSARALSGLKKRKVSDLTGSVHASLDVIFAHRLKTKKIKALVKSLVKGNPETLKISEAEDKNRETPADGSDDSQKKLELLEKVKTEITRGDGQTTYQDELKDLLEKGTDENQEGEDSGKRGKAGKKLKSASQNNPSLFWESMVGIKYMSQLRKRAKKGELTTNDKALIVIDNIYKGFKWVAKKLWKYLLEPVLKAVGHWFKETFGKAFSKIMAWAIPLLIVAAFIWGAGKVYQYAIVNPLHWLERKVVSGFHGGGSENSPAPVPVSQPVASVAPVKEIAPVPKKNEKPKQTVVYQPAVSFIPNSSSTQTLYDPKLLEQEIAAIPANSIVKDYVFQPDEGMPADLAVSRLQDLTDEDKYTMWIGSEKVKILSVIPSSTNFTITYQSTDLFGLLGKSSGTMNIFLEDIKYIHINEIDHFSKPGAQPDIKYQCTVVAKGAKYPLTIQCNSKDDLENLVSTLEYFIRHSRLGHDAQPGGMPYPTQGLVLNGPNQVEKLWANSPADKAGLKLGDVIWSLDKNTQDQQDRKALIAALQALTPGPHTLYMINPADFAQAQSDVSFGRARWLNPKRYKVLLNI